MTDENAWHAPGDANPQSGSPAAQPSSTEPPSASPPPASPPSAPPSPPIAPPSGFPAGVQSPSGYYVPQQHPIAGHGWTPPPKPGLIPLRPLAFGTLLGASFRVLRRNPRPTFGIALLVQSVAVVLSLALVGVITFALVSRIDSATSEDESVIIAGSIGIGIVSFLITMLFSIVAGAILQGIIVVEVARGTLGEKLPLRKLWGFAKNKIWALIGWACFVGAVVLVAIALVAGIIVLMVMTMGVLGVVLSVILGLLAGAGFIVLGVWLSTKLSMVPSALVLEQIPLRAAIARSWTLTQGHFWRVFGIQLLVNFILSTASQIAIVPFSFVFGILMALVDPNGTGDFTALIWAIITYVLMIMVTLVLATITSIVMTATSALLYLDLRMRKEGLDLVLTRFVESRHMGADDNANPYLHTPAPAAASSTGYTFA